MANKNDEYKISDEKVSKDHNDLLKDVLKEEKEKKNKKEEKDSDGFNGKKLKHGSLSLALTCAFVAVLVLVNIVATTLFDRYPITIDLTKDKIYTASEETEKYVKSVDTDVLVTIFANEDTFTSFSQYDQQAVELLKNYCKLNHHITYRFVDIDSNPEIAKSYESVNAYDIVFETSSKVDGKEVKRTRIVTLVDLVNFTSQFTESLSNSGMTIDSLVQQAGSAAAVLYYYKDNIESSNADQAFASALMTVTDPNPQYVTFLTGRNEITELSYFSKLLTANGYNVNSVDITKEDIPENTNIAVIPAPKNDYQDTEITKLSNFLNNNEELGKQLIYVASYSQDETPKLDEFLAEYGIKIGQGVVCETYQGNYYNAPYITLTTNVSDSFKQDLQTKEPVIISQFSRPVETLFDSQGMNTTEKYVTSSKDAYTANISVTSTGLKVGDHLSDGQQTYMAIGSKAKFGEGTQANSYSNVIAFGTEYLLSDEALSYAGYQNSEYFLSVINGISHKTQGITVAPKTVTGSLFDINELQKNVLKWTFCLIVPGVVLIIGIVVWVRRKNR